MFAAPPVIEASVFAEVPEHLRTVDKPPSRWIQIRRKGQKTHSFLEGPSFDRDGNLYLVDLANGRVFKVTPDGTINVVADYNGEPNGLKIHKDGRIFIADHRQGIVLLDPVSGKIEPFLTSYRMESFKGLNDLIFASNGDLYFTDQGDTGLSDPTGRLFCLRAGGQLDLLLDNIPSPNGLVLTPDESTLYLAVTRANAIWRIPFEVDQSISRVGVFIQLSGSLAGPDGLAIDSQGRLVVCHNGLGCVWVFDSFGEPVWRINSTTGRQTTNAAFGGPDNKTLFITESATGTVLRADLDIPGNPMYSHLE